MFAFHPRHSSCARLSAAGLIFALMAICSIGPAGASPPVGDQASSTSPSQAPSQSPDAAAEILSLLRSQDQVLEGWARQMAHPEGVGPTQDEVRRFTQRLIRLGLRIQLLAETDPSLAGKHEALVERGKELAAATTHSRAQNAGLAVPGESIRRLRPAPAALVAAGQAGLPQSACDAAAVIGLETRAIAGLDGTNEALLRFVPKEAGRYLLDTAGSRTDTTLRVLSSCRGDELGRGDDEAGLRARVPFFAEAGVPVWIRIGSDREGWVRLNVKQLSEGVGTASISGVVTARATGLPIPGIRLRAQLDGGSYYIVYANEDGTYEFTSLAAGTYEVYTEVYGGAWLNQIWQDMDCGVDSNSCSSLTGDPIAVVVDQAVENIDFSLAKPSVLTGTVTDTATGEPLSGVEIELHKSDEFYWWYAGTDSSGRYRFTAVEPGSYFLTTDSPSHKDELFDDIDCSTGCDISTGTPVVAEADAVTTGIDFALDRVATITGTVVAASDANPVSQGSVYVFDENGNYVNDGYVNNAGEFSVSISEPGIYFARTDFYYSEPWINQMWQGVDCTATCDLGLATAIEVGASEIVEISFSVLEKGRVEGVVTAADAGSLGDSYSTRVVIYDDQGFFVEDEYVQPGGGYELAGLLAGDYFLKATNFEFRSEVYDSQPCPTNDSCVPSSGTAVSVTLGTTTSGIDFSLDRLGVIEGTITQNGSAVPLVGVSILVAPFGSPFTNEESLLGHLEETDENGDYRVVGIEPGSYTIRTQSLEWQDEAYDDLPCEGGCDLTLATPVAASIGTVSGAINFQLQRTAWIEGTVTDADTGDPLSADLYLFDSSGDQVRSTDTNNGEYAFYGLEDGSYYLVTRAQSEFADELFEDIPCEYVSYGNTTCDVMTGTPIVVSVESGATVDFELQLGGAIEGVIKDSFGQPIYGDVNVYDPLGNLIRSVNHYSSYRAEGLAAGDYYLVTSSTGFQDELWPNAPCLGQPTPACTLTDGVPISVTLGNTETGIDFVLDPLATISGQSVDALTGDPVDGSMALYNSSGIEVTTDYDNPFKFTEIPPGTYYLRSRYSAGHLEQVYGGDTCTPSCDVTTGTPIVVGIGDVVTGIEVPLIMGPGLWGRVIDGPTGDPVPGVSIDVWNSDGDHLFSALADAQGEYRLPTYDGTFFLSTDNQAGFIDLVFDGIECPNGSAWEGLCDPTLGTPYGVEPYQPLQRLDFAFGDPTVFADGFEGGLGAWSVVVGSP